ncbi:Holliday junction branch migration protein RuvA [Blattabacterium cuenoti]|uniref:Holliday junction branch migration protein RuvA n=1 Tax=Blattabacterium cuenoti TaxID=1653831 RepID=UPI00163BFEA6|nr:Holliday junction branch migration protein RuvA [Blattabacterium cuenoti]
MITHLRGKIIEKNKSNLIVDCWGVGYKINISLYTYYLLKNEEKEVLIYTYLFIRENQQILYGFFDKKERKIFLYLISVNGVGPNLAILLLSSLTPYEIEKSIYEENIITFKNVKGIGNKIAQKIVIELKDKINKYYKAEKEKKILNDHVKKEALNALNVLGFYSKESKQLLDNIFIENPNFSVENLVKEFLKKKK